MNPITFTEDKISDLFRYEFFPRDESEFISRTFTQNKKLFEAWAEAEENTQYLKYCVSNFGSGENIPLLLALIWRLVQGRYLYAITPYETEGTASLIHKQWQSIKWEYGITHEYTDTTVGYQKIDSGFSRARSPLMMQYGRPVQKIPFDETGLFSISERNDFFRLPQAGFGDVVSTINLFCCREKREAELIALLNTDTAPTLAGLLNEDDIFVAAQFGVDMGYYDYLVIYSKMTLASQLNYLAGIYGKSINSYETQLMKISTMTEFDKLLEVLLWPDYNENGT